MNFTNSITKHITKLVGTLKSEDELQEILKRKFTKREYKTFIAFEEGKNIDEIKTLLKEDDEKEFYWLEFAKKGSTKKDALIFLKDYLKINNLVTFGDNLNDVSMFSIADESYAVGNAHSDLKKLATEVIGTNIENAVANKIKNDFEL